MTRYSIKYSPKSLVRRSDCDTVFYIEGKKDHGVTCSGGGYWDSVGGERKFIATCDCGIVTDSIVIFCPKCGHDGVLYLRDGLTARDRPGKYDVFDISGGGDDLTVGGKITCTSCLSRFTVTKGVMSEVGVVKLPEVTEDEFKSILRQRKSFVDVESFIESASWESRS